MEPGRGVLARVDRRLHAGLGQDETWRMVRVPTTPAMWSTWKRYCETAGVSMGQAIAICIGYELSKGVGETESGDSPVLAGRADEELARREEEVTRRERKVEAAEARLHAWAEHLRRWEHNLETRERRTDVIAELSDRPEHLWGRVGRNEPCPCGSGRKYKRLPWSGRCDVMTARYWGISQVEEALACSGDEPLGPAGNAQRLPEGVEVASGVPFGASKAASDRGDGVAAGEMVEDDPVPVGQHDSGQRFESGRQGCSQVSRDGEVTGHHRRKDRLCFLDGDIGGHDSGCAGSHHGTHGGLIDDVSDDDLGNPTVRSSGSFGPEDESDVGLCGVVVGDETGRDAAEHPDEP